MTAPQPCERARSTALSVSLSVPIWLSLMRMALAAFGQAAEGARVGHEVVTDELAAITDTRRQGLPALPVVLGEAVLEADDGVPGDPIGPEVDHLARLERAALPGQPVGELTLGIGLAVDELGHGRVEGDRHLVARTVAGPLDGLQDRLDGGLVRGQRRGEAALVPLSRGKPAVVQLRLQGVEDLDPARAPPKHRRRQA
jgi:hypothetical protein